MLFSQRCCVMATASCLWAGLAPTAQSVKRLESPNLVQLLNSGTVDGLAGSLRGYLVRSLPDPLYEASPGWGHQERAIRGVKWTGKVLPLRPEVMHGEANQGIWKKIRVTAVNRADTLVFDIRDLRSPEPGRITFTIFTTFDARVEYTRQRWEAGVKLFDASARARLRIKLNLQCEASARLELKGLMPPDAVVRLHVVQSNVQWENFVLEHVAGIGGEAAKLFGETVQKSIRQWHPSLERDLQAKANAAIVKAADTKEVRVNLSQLLRKAANAK
jgi:hypothetical protein